MSDDIYDDAFGTETEGMKRERMEMTVDIYESADHVRDYDFKTETNTHKLLQPTGSDSVKSRSSRAAVVCLVLLCVLLLTAVIVLCVHVYTNNTNYTQERDQLLTKITNLTEERDQLLTKITNLTEERDPLLTKITNLTEERDQLLTKITNLTEERDPLLTKITNLTEERDPLLTKITNLTEERDPLLTKITNLTEERDELLTKITNLTEERDPLLTKITNLTEERDPLLTKITNLTEERDQLLTKITNLTEERDKLIIKNKNLLNKTDQLINQLSILGKDDKWFYYQFSFYYMSNETKSWTESRQDCLKKGADLIIINSSEEQDFVKNSTVNREFWIGVTDSDVEDRWKWVDGSTLTSGFWVSSGGIKEPGGGTTENCAVTYLKAHPNLLGWHDVKCNDAYQWICEKSILPLLQY